MTRDDFRRQADLVRAIPLEVVLTSWGAVRDRKDKARWHTERGPLSVTGAQFFNWHDRRGGGGAIDLVIHLGDWDARQAIRWLWRHLGHALPNAGRTDHTRPVAGTGRDTSASRHGSPLEANNDARHRCQQLCLPTASSANLQRVRRYLVEQRGLSPEILDPLVAEGKLYADRRGNAVFLMVAGKPNRAIGAELRGTGSTVWRGLAGGTRKDAGYFWIGNVTSKQVVLCESAIDAISCFQLHGQSVGAPLPGECICISTAGIRSDAPWLRPLIGRGYEIYCGFDADDPGETASRQMISRHPSIQRLRPPQHDWNDVLTGRHQ